MERKELLRMYHEMVLIRRIEQRAAELYQQGKIGGFLHLYIGQEAISTGIGAARQPQDRLITAYRDHGVAISSGIDANRVMAELLGKRTGTSLGFGGSMHMADTDKNYWGGHAIVGSHLLFAAGMGLADQYQKNDSVTICLFGDGATNIGFFHEALNLAGVWDLPVLWVCENNKYGMGTAVERASAVSEIHQKAEAYGMPHSQIDGMNVLEVYQAASKALEHVRKEGPYFLEVVAYRFEGHSMGDPERYRTKDEVGEWEANDPIGVFRTHLVEKEKVKENELDKIERQVQTEVDEAVEFAESSEEPTWDDLVSSVYVEPNRDEQWLR
ncbi:MAG TPA: pyruvate dehydrogenase (acetyl-transferring) E1 component subunit alpha [Anaerolineales bacterium]|jgi:pyruvate dehydrogenase E1 component alpha subunit